MDILQKHGRALYVWINYHLKVGKKWKHLKSMSIEKLLVRANWYLFTLLNPKNWYRTNLVGKFMTWNPTITLISLLPTRVNYQKRCWILFIKKLRKWKIFYLNGRPWDMIALIFHLFLLRLFRTRSIAYQVNPTLMRTLTWMTILSSLQRNPWKIVPS